MEKRSGWTLSCCLCPQGVAQEEGATGQTAQNHPPPAGLPNSAVSTHPDSASRHPGLWALMQKAGRESKNRERKEKNKVRGKRKKSRP